MGIFDDGRIAWGAAPSTWTATQAATNTVPPAQRLGISWHYPGEPITVTAASPHTACYSLVKAWQHYHQASNGWADIGYNLLVCPHGRVIEGRGVDFKGAHSPGVNWVHYGVQFMVPGDSAPTPIMYARAVRLRGDLEAHSAHRLRQWGHKDDPQASTDCPGPVIEAWVHSGGPYAATPAPTTTPTTKEGPLVATEQDAVDLFTTYRICRNALSATPDTAPRVAPSFLLESSARLAQNANTLATAARADVAALRQDLDAKLAALDPSAVQATISAAVAQALAGLSVTLTSKPSA